MLRNRRHWEPRYVRVLDAAIAKAWRGSMRISRCMCLAQARAGQTKIQPGAPCEIMARYSIRMTPRPNSAACRHTVRAVRAGYSNVRRATSLASPGSRNLAKYAGRAFPGYESGAKATATTLCPGWRRPVSNDRAPAWDARRGSRRLCFAKKHRTLALMRQA
ncbi:MAG: hypothetical protein RL385_3422 [Pseudomonadota bacterium]|jgi:hypothetical protein